MARNQNTAAKRNREMEKKRKAEDKRERRRLRKQPDGGPAAPETELAWDGAAEEGLPGDEPPE